LQPQRGACSFAASLLLPWQANFKQGLAKLQAGNYDTDAVSAKLNGLINETPVVMFSFST